MTTVVLFMAREDPQLKFRVPAELREALEAAASTNGRSLSSEIVHRLEQSFVAGTSAAVPQAVVRASEWMKAFQAATADASNQEALRAQWARQLISEYFQKVDESVFADAIAEKVASAVDERLADAVLEEPSGRRIVLQLKHRTAPVTLKKGTSPAPFAPFDPAYAGPGIPGYDAERVKGKQTVNVAPTANPAVGAFFDDIEGWMRNAGFDHGMSLDAQRAAQSEAAKESAKRFSEANKAQKRRYTITPGLKAYWREKAERRRARKTED